MKLSDYLVEYLVEKNIKHVFLIIGGACAHIVDSLGKNKKISYICMQHEQAAAMAADAYARLTDNLGVTVVTSGPGATNLITGLCCSWFDSIPTIMISGQVNLWETKGDRKIRQLGFQETDIVEIVKPITKFAAMVTQPEKIRYYLDKAFYLAKIGRPGPVWLDIPQNVQHAEIEPDKLAGFEPKEIAKEKDLKLLKNQVRECLRLTSRAKRPIILAGFGIRVAGAIEEFKALVKTLDFPVVSTWSGADILPENHPNYIGRIGVYGARGANFTIQNSDLLISVGSRLDTRQTGGQPDTFARVAKKIVVDIDSAELNKGWVKADLPINFDVKDFLNQINKQLVNFAKPKVNPWLKRCGEWKIKYPTVLPEYYQQKGSVNAYVFIKALSDELGKDDVIFTDEGGNLTWTLQAFEVKAGQRLISAFGNSPMGYAFPAAIGAWFAKGGKRIICIDGDGGFQLNIQELQTLACYKAPIKVFILNNHSYGIIKQFQEIYFDARYEGSVAKTGYTCPDFLKVAKAYGLETASITSHQNLRKKIRKVLNSAGCVICDVFLSEDQKLNPKLVAVKTPQGKYISKPIEDQVPLLPRKEFLANMIVGPLKEQRGKKKTSEIN